jgi:hypothetical protein
MRDDRAKWAPPGAARSRQALQGAVLTPVTGLRQTLLSGPRVLAPDDCGWPDIVRGATYRVALRRDRVLEIGGAAGTPGWDAARGLAAFALLQRGTEITLGVPSRSVVRPLFGLSALVYRREAETFRLHVGAAQAEALVHLLCRADAARQG